MGPSLLDGVHVAGRVSAAIGRCIFGVFICPATTPLGLLSKFVDASALGLCLRERFGDVAMHEPCRSLYAKSSEDFVPAHVNFAACLGTQQRLPLQVSKVALLLEEDAHDSVVERRLEGIQIRCIIRVHDKLFVLRRERRRLGVYSDRRLIGLASFFDAGVDVWREHLGDMISEADSFHYGDVDDTPTIDAIREAMRDEHVKLYVKLEKKLDGRDVEFLNVRQLSVRLSTNPKYMSQFLNDLRDEKKIPMNWKIGRNWKVPTGKIGEVKTPFMEWLGRRTP